MLHSASSNNITIMSSSPFTITVSIPSTYIKYKFLSQHQLPPKNANLHSEKKHNFPFECHIHVVYFFTMGYSCGSFLLLYIYCKNQKCVKNIEMYVVDCKQVIEDRHKFFHTLIIIFLVQVLYSNTCHSVSEWQSNAR